MIEAVILAGGKGSRLWPVVKDIPKPMAEVSGKPFIEYLIRYLRVQGIERIVISLGYLGDNIRGYFGTGDRWGVKISYSFEQDFLGTGGALKQAVSFIKGDTFLALNGDSFLGMDISSFYSFHMCNNATVSLGLARVNDAGRYGIVEINKCGQIIKFVEKDRGTLNSLGLVNGGVYLLSRKVFSGIKEDVFSLEKDLFPDFINRGLYGMIADRYFIDIGVPDDYIDLCRKPGEFLGFFTAEQ